MAWQAFRQYGRSFGSGFIIGLPIYITFTDLGFCVARVDGISMQPSLNPTTKESDVVLLDRWTARDVFNVKRGDVVSLISPSDPDVKLIKRVIGLEGDIIKTIGYKKPYVSIPKGHCWVEGDHRGKSYDSNKFGPISLGLVNGIATHVVWPPKRWMKIEANVAKDRVPLRRSFNHCMFGNLLKNSKEFDEPGDNGNSKGRDTEDSRDKEVSRDTEDIVLMKRKFLSDDRFLKRDAVTVPGEEINPDKDSVFIKISESDIPKLDDDPRDNSEISLEKNSSLGNNEKGLIEDSQIDSGHNENEISDVNRGNGTTEEADVGEYRSNEIMEDISSVQRNNLATGCGESGFLITVKNLAEGNSNKDFNVENCSEIFVAGTERAS